MQNLGAAGSEPEAAVKNTSGFSLACHSVAVFNPALALSGHPVSIWGLSFVVYSHVKECKIVSSENIFQNVNNKFT